MRYFLFGLLFVSFAHALPYDVDNAPLQQDLEYLEAMARKNAMSIVNTSSVTAVTATAPLSSSGGSVPNIALSGTWTEAQVANLVPDLAARASSGTNANLTSFKSTYTFLAGGTFMSSVTVSTTASISTLTIPSPGILSFPGYLMFDKNGVHRFSQDPNAAPADTRDLRIEAQHGDADTASGGSIILEGGTAGGGTANKMGGSLFFIGGTGNNTAGGALVFQSGSASSCDTVQSSATFTGGQADGRGQGGSFVLKSAAPTGDCGVNVGGGSVQFNGGFGSGNQPGGSMSFTSGVGGPSGVGGNITISASSGSTNGSIFVGGLTYSTFTRAGTLNMGAPFNLMTKTLAELKAIAPAIGDLYRCSNCVVPFSIAEGTGTSAGNFAIFAPGAFQ